MRFAPAIQKGVIGCSVEVLGAADQGRLSFRRLCSALQCKKLVDADSAEGAKWWEGIAQLKRLPFSFFLFLTARFLLSIAVFISYLAIPFIVSTLTPQHGNTW